MSNPAVSALRFPLGCYSKHYVQQQHQLIQEKAKKYDNSPRDQDKRDGFVSVSDRKEIDGVAYKIHLDYAPQDSGENDFKATYRVQEFDMLKNPYWKRSSIPDAALKTTLSREGGEVSYSSQVWSDNGKQHSHIKGKIDLLK